MKSLKSCQRCGERFLAPTLAKLYCSDFCRRHYQDERRKAERMEERYQRQIIKRREIFLDPWVAPQDCFGANALLDGWA